MKYIYLFVFLLTTNLISAQDLRLFENAWYSTKIVENGIDYFPPTDIEVPGVSFIFDQQNYSIRTSADICNQMSGEITFGNDLVSFLSHSLWQTLRMCDLESDAYLKGDAYYSSYSSVIRSDTNFSYTISENGTAKTLTITNLSNSNQAQYSSQNLATVDFKELNFSVYSDPSTDFVTVELKGQNTENTKVELFDSLGKICKSNYFNSSQIKISTADLCSGVYIVKVTTDNEVGVRKFIKS